MFGIKRAAMAKCVTALLATALVVLGGLVGCGLGEPKSAQDVFSRYVATKGIDNFKGTATVDASMTILGQKVPLSLDSTFEAAGGSVYSKNNTTLFGQALASEVYWQRQEDGYIIYSSAGEGDAAAWSKTRLESKASDDSSNTSDFAYGLVVADKLLSGTQFSKSDTGYVLTVPGASLWESISMSQEFKDATKDIDTSAFEQGLRNAEVVLSFDKECRLTGIATEMQMTISSSGEASALSLESTVTVKLDVKLHDYGSVLESDVVVPEDVQKNAVDTDDLLNVFADPFGDTTAQEDTQDKEAA